MVFVAALICVAGLYWFGVYLFAPTELERQKKAQSLEAERRNPAEK